MLPSGSRACSFAILALSGAAAVDMHGLTSQPLRSAASPSLLRADVPRAWRSKLLYEQQWHAAQPAELRQAPRSARGSGSTGAAWRPGRHAGPPEQRGSWRAALHAGGGAAQAARASCALAPCRRPSSRGQRSLQVGLLGALRWFHRSVIENAVCGRGAAAQVRARGGMKQMRRGPPSGALCGRCWRRSPGGRALWSMRTHMPSRAGGPATLRRRLCEAAARSLRGMGAMSLRKRHGHCHASQACTAPSGTPLCCAQAAGRGAAHS